MRAAVTRIYGDKAVAAIADLERVHGTARVIPPGPLLDRLTREVPGGWRADATLVDIGPCPTHCPDHRDIRCVWPSGLVEELAAA